MAISVIIVVLFIVKN